MEGFLNSMLISVIVLLLIHLDSKEKFNVKSYVVSIIILSLVMWGSSFVFKWFDQHIAPKIPFLPEFSEIHNFWIGAVILLGIVCFFSYKGWKQLNEKRNR